MAVAKKLSELNVADRKRECEECDLETKERCVTRQIEQLPGTD